DWVDSSRTFRLQTKEFSNSALWPEMIINYTVAGYPAWVDGWGVDLGAETDDFDGDGLLNIAEYAFGGDPTNTSNSGTFPTFGIVDAGGGSHAFNYVHPQLSDPDSELAYHLLLSTNLMDTAWANAGYSILGTNVTGGSLNFVTNAIDAADREKFIRLMVVHEPAIHVKGVLPTTRIFADFEDSPLGAVSTTILESGTAVGTWTSTASEESTIAHPLWSSTRWLDADCGEYDLGVDFNKIKPANGEAVVEFDFCFKRLYAGRDHAWSILQHDGQEAVRLVARYTDRALVYFDRDNNETILGTGLFPGGGTDATLSDLRTVKLVLAQDSFDVYVQDALVGSNLMYRTDGIWNVDCLVFQGLDPASGAFYDNVSISTDPIPTFGAIRWDVWVGTNYVDWSHGRWNEESLYPEKWRNRLPFFGGVKGFDSVETRITQEVMDDEIEVAAGALDYWAFLDYPAPDPMHQPLEYYLNSSTPSKDKVEFSIILNARNWWTDKQTYVDYFLNSRYQTVYMNNEARPLVYSFNTPSAVDSFGGDWAAYKEEIDELVQMSMDQGAGDPYFVVMDSSAVGALSVANLGFDAISAYVTGAAATQAKISYGNSTVAAKSQWTSRADTRCKVVPTVSAGWDTRPRQAHWATYQPDSVAAWEDSFVDGWIQKPNPKELADHIKDAMDWVATHPFGSPAKTVIAYAWNEHSEGGYLCPTYSIAAQNNGAVYLDFIEDMRSGGYSLELWDLVGDWRFDYKNVGGDARNDDIYDYSQYRNHAYREASNIYFVDSPYGAGGNCIQIASGDVVRVPDHSSLEGMEGLTLSCWVWLSDLADGERSYCISKADIYRLGIDVDRSVQFTVGTTDADWDTPGTSIVSSESGAVPIEGWVHLAATYHSTAHELALYVNGQGVTNMTTSISGALKTYEELDVSSYDPDIGDVFLGAGSFSGRLDEVRIYRRGLSPSEIEDLYNAYQ
ncbi:MAG: LamG-like jellyroll fold domain-containing protein, partial [Verrucomicrobiota bacterium]|nr:LamG-like jellyroll fold domain-containing protein [Verrucomicrobiota bacterium]